MGQEASSGPDDPLDMDLCELRTVALERYRWDAQRQAWGEPETLDSSDDVDPQNPEIPSGLDYGP